MPKDGKYTAYVESGDLCVPLPSNVRDLTGVALVLYDIFKDNPPDKLGQLTRIKYANKNQSCYVATQVILEMLGVPA